MPALLKPTFSVGVHQCNVRPAKESSKMFGKRPVVTEVKLSRDYLFMYENFVLATQSAVYLLLEKRGDAVFALRFNSPNCRYGGPNDEAHGGHPLTQYGLGIYGLYEVENSPWIADMLNANRVHPGHQDWLFEGKKHFIACFKDVKFESVCSQVDEVVLNREEFSAIFERELDALEA
jgi:hypothetical protein